MPTKQHPEATQKMTTTCCDCKRFKTALFAKVKRYVSGTAMTRQRTPVFVCNDCLWKRQEFNDANAKRDNIRTAKQIVANGLMTVEQVAELLKLTVEEILN